jgi:hypothetical protein
MAQEKSDRTGPDDAIAAAARQLRTEVENEPLPDPIRRLADRLDRALKEAGKRAADPPES